MNMLLDKPVVLTTSISRRFVWSTRLPSHTARGQSLTGLFRGRQTLREKVVRYLGTV